MNTPHDGGYKRLFSHPEFVRDLITGFVPDPWLQSLDFTTLERYPGSYVPEDLKERADDIVWRLKVAEDWCYVYLLIEFQSTVDPFMAVRVMTYLGLLYQDLTRPKKGQKRLQHLPPVLPIVLYNGHPRWTAPVDMADLIPPLPAFLERFRPRLRYFLISEWA
ncbi:MAG: Rpn family recombination-promoting nuclease/putative transposase, partial [Pseudomonadota bacterium]